MHFIPVSYFFKYQNWHALHNINVIDPGESQRAEYVGFTIKVFFMLQEVSLALPPVRLLSDSMGCYHHTSVPLYMG